MDRLEPGPELALLEPDPPARQPEDQAREREVGVGDPPVDGPAVDAGEVGDLVDTTYRQWELFDAAPSAETLKKTARLLGVAEWRQLFLWLSDGVGEAPSWLDGKDPVPEAGDDEDEEPLPHRPSVTVSRRVPVPWRALELLVRQGREAEEKGNPEEVKEIEAAVRELVWPDLPRKTEPKPSTSPTTTAAPPPPASGQEGL